MCLEVHNLSSTGFFVTAEMTAHLPILLLFPASNQSSLSLFSFLSMSSFLSKGSFIAAPVPTWLHSSQHMYLGAPTVLLYT